MSRENGDRYQRFFEHVPIGLYQTTPDGNIIDVNPALLALMGYETLEQFQALKAEEIYVNPADRLAWREIIEKEDVVRNFEMQLRRADGTPIWVRDNVHVVHDADGKVLYYEGSLEDISDLKQAEDTARDSADWFRKLFESSPDAIVLIDPHYKETSWPIVECNEAACEMNGYTRSELIGQSIDLLHETPAVPADREDFFQRLRTQSVFKGEAEHRRKDGTLFPIQYSTSLITLGGREMVLGIDRDITERKSVEAKLQENRRALHLVISSMPNLLMRVDTQDRLSAFAAPPNFMPFLSPTEEPLKKSLSDLFPSSVAGPLLHAMKKARDAGQPSSFDYSITTGDKTNYFAVKVSPMVDSNEVLVLADNITDRKLAEMAEHDQRMLAEVLREIAMLLNSTLDMEEVLSRILENLEKVIPYDTADIMLIDRDIARVVGVRGYAERGVNMEVLSAQHRIADIANFNRIVQTGKPILVQDTVNDPTWVDLPATRLIRSYIGAPIIIQGEVIGFINLGSITPNFYTPTHVERLEAISAQAATAIHNAQLYQSIQQQAVELETANRELEAFSHTVAHDLKAPLQVTTGYASLMEAEYGKLLDDEGRNMLLEIKKSSFRMGSMIESLLLLAKLRDVEETLHLVEMKPVAEGAVARFQDQIKARGFQIDIEEPMPSAMGYGPWVEEVFANLIGNAIKYTSKDNPAPRIQIRGVDYGSMVRYEVQDNGLGIAPKDQARLFEMFSRFHTDQAQGFGLGLSIVQRVVTRLHGQAGADSEPGQGSTFWFTLRKQTQASS